MVVLVSMAGKPLRLAREVRAAFGAAVTRPAADP